MSYVKSFGAGFDFNDLKDSIGLSGTKPFVRHLENGIGLHGFNGLGKAQGTNALGAALVLGGSALLGGGGAGAGAGASAPGFSGTQAAAPIVDLSTPAVAGGTPGMGSAGRMVDVAKIASQLSDMGGGSSGGRRPEQAQQPIHWQAPYNPMNDPAVQSLQAQQQRRAVADALLAQAQGAGYTKIGVY